MSHRSTAGSTDAHLLLIDEAQSFQNAHSSLLQVEGVHVQSRSALIQQSFAHLHSQVNAEGLHKT
jgi:hypothetical protein